MVSLKPSEINQSAPSTSSAGQNQSTENAERNGSKKPLDIVFLQDTTGSQGPYIKAACSAIRDICDKISATAVLSKNLIRFGLIAFRDHPPQDNTYVTKNFGFTSDIGVIQRNLTGLVASGGGDGPEAQTAALADALNLEWTDDAIKIVILITDSPPHGLGEDKDGFSESPDQNDPLQIVRQMAERGITLFVVACEPALSNFKYALDFYAALTNICSGLVFPLLQADKLGDYIVATAVETIETEQLIGEYEKLIVNDVYTKAMPLAQVAENLQQYMNSKGVKINTMNVEDIYTSNEVAKGNQRSWAGANKLADARGLVKEVYEPRIRSEWRIDPSTVGEEGIGFSWEGGLPRAPMPRRASKPMAKNSRQRSCKTRPKDSTPAQAQGVSMAAQQPSMRQTHRIVMQSVARTSTVTATGMISKEGGQTISFPSEELPPWTM